MAVNQTFENLIGNQLVKLCELEMATAFILSKSTMKGVLEEAKQHIDAIKRNVSNVRQDLDKMHEEIDTCKKLIVFSQVMDEKVKHMEQNIPLRLIQTLSKSDTEEARVHTQQESTNSSAPQYSQRTQPNNDLVDPTEYLPRVQDCRKTLFKDPEYQYCIENLTEAEFSKIPKYMIGRQTLSNLNEFIAAINKVMTAKYTLLALGKVGARKKGELDLYLQFKKEESDVCAGKKRKYFFTAEDYQREIKAKLDKTKLNLLTVLRHCKRLQELRFGKNIKYEVITVR